MGQKVSTIPFQTYGGMDVATFKDAVKLNQNASTKQIATKIQEILTSPDATPGASEHLSAVYNFKQNHKITIYQENKIPIFSFLAKKIYLAYIKQRNKWRPPEEKTYVIFVKNKEEAADKIAREPKMPQKEVKDPLLEEKSDPPSQPPFSAVQGPPSDFLTIQEAVPPPVQSPTESGFPPFVPPPFNPSS